MNPINDLSQEMQKRLDKWNSKSIKNQPNEKQKNKNYIPRKDYGDYIDEQPGSNK